MLITHHSPVQSTRVETVFHVRKIMERNQKEIGGGIRWNLPRQLPLVLAESRGLLQAFLNLAKNSHRAVQNSNVR
jgi:nitrogen-specific signal transduction histidine kinase